MTGGINAKKRPKHKWQKSINEKQSFRRFLQTWAGGTLL